MDMIIKAIANAGAGIEYAPRRELDRVFDHLIRLQQAVLSARELCCEEQDAQLALDRLDELTALLAKRRGRLRDAALEGIGLQARNGRNVVGMFPCTTGDALHETLAVSIARVRAALGDGLPALVTIGHGDMKQVDMESVRLHPQHIEIGECRWLMDEISAVSRLDGFGFLAGSMLVRVDCDLPELGMTTDDVRDLRPGTMVVTMEETSGESADGQERTYPIGTLAEVSRVETLPMPQGLSVTVVIGPQDGDEAIVNVFDEGDAWFPIEPANTAVMQPAPDRIEEAFVRVCEALGVPATAGAYLEVPRVLAAARQKA
jgi:hypothetical protein